MSGLLHLLLPKRLPSQTQTRGGRVLPYSEHGSASGERRGLHFRQ